MPYSENSEQSVRICESYLLARHTDNEIYSFDQSSDMFGKGSEKKLFETICKSMDKLGYKYKTEPDDHLVYFPMNGSDLKFNVVIDVLEEHETVSFAAKMEFDVPEEQFAPVLYELNKLNQTIIFGKFVLKEEANALYYVFGMPLEDYRISVDTMASIINMFVGTVDSVDGILHKLVTDGGWKKKENDLMFG